MLKILSERRMCYNMLLYSVLELMPCCRAAAHVICANPKCTNNKYSNRVLTPYVQIHFQGSTCCGVVEVARMVYSGLCKGRAEKLTSITCKRHQLLALSGTPNCLSSSVLPQQDALWRHIQECGEKSCFCPC